MVAGAKQTPAVHDPGKVQPGDGADQHAPFSQTAAGPQSPATLVGPASRRESHGKRLADLPGSRPLEWPSIHHSINGIFGTGPASSLDHSMPHVVVARSASATRGILTDRLAWLDRSVTSSELMGARQPVLPFLLNMEDPANGDLRRRHPQAQPHGSAVDERGRELGSHTTGTASADHLRLSADHLRLLAWARRFGEHRT